MKNRGEIIIQLAILATQYNKINWDTCFKKYMPVSLSEMVKKNENPGLNNKKI